MAKQVGHYEIPKWTELSVEKMWPVAVNGIKDFMKYMPDNFKGDHKTDRSFFWGVFYSLNPAFVEELVEDCRLQRKPKVKPQGPDFSKNVVSRKWAAQLLTQPAQKSKYTSPT